MYVTRYVSGSHQCTSRLVCPAKPIRWKGRPSGKYTSKTSGVSAGRNTYSRLAGPLNGAPLKEAKRTVPSSRQYRPPSSWSVKRTTPVKVPRVPLLRSRSVRSTDQEPRR